MVADFYYVLNNKNNYYLQFHVQALPISTYAKHSSWWGAKKNYKLIIVITTTTAMVVATVTSCNSRWSRTEAHEYIMHMK